MSEDTEDIRRVMIMTGLMDRKREAAHMKWDTEALRAEFEVIGFAAPFVVVKRKSDGQKGSLEFANSPREYFNFEPYEE